MALSDEPKLTWQDKLKQGIKMTVLEETKADADFNYKRRLREEEERKAYEASKLTYLQPSDQLKTDETKGIK